MTMLDRMRRHQGWLKWSLGLVVLTFVFFYVPDFLSPTTGTGVDRRRRGHRPGSAHHRRATSRGAYNAQMAAVPERVRRQHEHRDAASAGARPPGAAADDRPAGRHRRGHAPGDHGDRRRGARADHAASRPSRRTGSSSASSATGSSCACSGRRITAAEFEDEIRNSVDPRQDAGDAHRVDHRLGRRGRRRIPPPQREGHPGAGVVPGRVVPATRCRSTDAEVAALLRAEQGDVPHRRASQGAVPAARRPGDPRTTSRCPSRTSSAHYRQNIDQYSTARAGARQPHPAEDRGQGRGGRAQARPKTCSRRSRPAATSRRWPRPTRRIPRARARAATSTSSARAGWCRSSRPWPSRCQSGRLSDLVRTPVRLPHHQGHRQEGGRGRSRSTRCGRRSPSSSSSSGPRRACRTSRRPSPPSCKTPADLDKAAAIARAEGPGVAAVCAQRADSPGSGPRRRSPSRPSRSRRAR